METDKKKRAKVGLILTSVCLICDIVLTVYGFVSGNIISGMGWMCALFANLQVIGYIFENYNE